jgi:hypothetical protein
MRSMLLLIAGGGEKKKMQKVRAASATAGIGRLRRISGANGSERGSWIESRSRYRSRY